MRLLGFAYRFVTNFAFLATVYLSLNYIEKYNNRAILAIAILIYAGMRAAIALRSFYFFQRIEQLEIEARRVMALFTEQGAQPPLKKQTVADDIEMLVPVLVGVACRKQGREQVDEGLAMPRAELAP